jgi:hypothetical protein
MTEGRPTEPQDVAEVARLVDRLGSADIRWNGTFYGLMPTIVGDAARQLLASGAIAIPRLVDALEDESRFVAAHVLLTMLSGVEYPTAPWNGLEVELSADGEVRIDPDQRFKLGRHWRTWQGITPRPRSILPDLNQK